MNSFANQYFLFILKLALGIGLIVFFLLFEFLHHLALALTMHLGPFFILAMFRISRSAGKIISYNQHPVEALGRKSHKE